MKKEYDFSKGERGRFCRPESAEDTTLEAARIQFSILRRRGAAGRAAMAIELSDGLRGRNGRIWSPAAASRLQ